MKVNISAVHECSPATTGSYGPMRSDWLTWMLRAWAGLVLLIGVAAVVDHESADPPVAAISSIAPVADPSPNAAPPDLTTPVPDEPDAAPGAVPRPAAMPVAIEAPAVGIAADLVAVGKTSDGALAVPDFGMAGWYEHSVRPGETGAAVLAGHVDSTTGPDVFFTLRELGPGDEVVVRGADGVATTFVVDHVETTDKDQLPVDRIFGHTDRSELRLITCGGAFDRSVRSYESNVIVYATAVSSAELAAG